MGVHFIYSHVGRHLGGFHPVAIVNHASLYVAVGVLLLVLLGVHSEVELLGHVCILISYLEEPPNCSMAARPLYVSTMFMGRGFSLSSPAPAAFCATVAVLTGGVRWDSTAGQLGFP